MPGMAKQPTTKVLNWKEATVLLQKAADAASEGDTATAATIWQRLLPWVRQNAPKGSSILPQSLLQIGELQQRLGQLRQAERTYLDALAMSADLTAPSPLLIAIIQNNLADVYSDLERFAEARALLQRSLEQKISSLGPAHPEVGIGHSNFGDLLRQMGELDAAEEQLNRSLVVLEPHAADKPLALAAALNNASRLHQSRKQWGQAKQSLEQAQQLRLRVLPRTHPDLALGWNNLGMLALTRGDLESARRDLRRAHLQMQALYGDDHHLTALQVANLGRLAVDLGEIEEGAKQLQKAQVVFDAQLGPRHPSSLNNLAELLLVMHQNGRSEEHLNSLKRLLRSRYALFTSEAWRLSPREQLLMLRRRDLSWYLADALATKHPDVKQLALAQRLNTQGLLQEIQRESRRDSPTPQTPKQRRWIEPDEASAALPTSAVLIEMRRYLDPAALPRERREELPWRYQAYVLRPDQDLEVVDLGPATALDPLVEAAYVASVQQLEDATERWDALAKALIRPLHSIAGRYSEWFIVPDAGLHQVPFQALAPDRRIRLLTTGRDLIRNRSSDKPLPGQSVVAGNPSIPNDIPATQSEVKEVARLLGVRPVLGTAFNAPMLKSIKRPRVLHLATHGFWDESSKFPGHDPMLRSGVIVTAAVNSNGDLREERFTAADFLGADLDGTELVTLSACSTGLGGLHDSEGIYGLQRGVRVAGANSVLTSLWPVEDEATRDWMLRYYGHLISGMGRADALAAVQQEFRQHPKSDWRHPYFWAAWQIVGDWRPIDGL
jgi:CHAT domain-containing protein/Tfp pilus assembly protein PilF